MDKFYGYKKTAFIRISALKCLNADDTSQKSVKTGLVHQKTSNVSKENKTVNISVLDQQKANNSPFWFGSKSS